MLNDAQRLYQLMLADDPLPALRANHGLLEQQRRIGPFGIAPWNNISTYCSREASEPSVIPFNAVLSRTEGASSSPGIWRRQSARVRPISSMSTPASRHSLPTP